MRDQNYRRDQIPAYGGGAQPALAERMRPQLRNSRIGNALAVVAVLAALAAALTYSDFTAEEAGRGWAVAVCVCSVALLGLCTFQHVSWARALAVWEGRSGADLARVSRLSNVAHIASYVVVVGALVASIVSIAFASWLATSSILLVVAVLFMMVAQELAGVQYVRASGPPGALPTHMRKAIASQSARNQSGPTRSG